MSLIRHLAQAWQERWQRAPVSDRVRVALVAVCTPLAAWFALEARVEYPGPAGPEIEAPVAAPLMSEAFFAVDAPSSGIIRKGDATAAVVGRQTDAVLANDGTEPTIESETSAAGRVEPPLERAGVRRESGAVP